MFYNLITGNKGLRKTFELMPKIKPNYSHAFKRELLHKPLDSKLKIIIDQKKVQILKLNWKTIKNEYPENSTLAYIFNQQ
jgi:hypothetical protein